jgi:hypothetical protein
MVTHAINVWHVTWYCTLCPKADAGRLGPTGVQVLPQLSPLYAELRFGADSGYDQAELALLS